MVESDLCKLFFDAIPPETKDECISLSKVRHARLYAPLEDLTARAQHTGAPPPLIIGVQVCAFEDGDVVFEQGSIGSTLVRPTVLANVTVPHARMANVGK